MLEEAEFEEVDPYQAPNASPEVLAPDVRPTLQKAEFRPGCYAVVPSEIETVRIGRVSIKRRGW